MSRADVVPLRVAANGALVPIRAGVGVSCDTAVVEALCAWAERTPEVQRVYVFGSRARGDFRPDSDLDIAPPDYGTRRRQFPVHDVDR
jgi:hypothetical protein